MKEPEDLYRKRYWGVLLLFEEDIKRMLDLFTAHCQQVDAFIDGKELSSRAELDQLPALELKSLLIRGYQHIPGESSALPERVRLVELKITKHSAKVSTTDRTRHSDRDLDTLLDWFLPRMVNYVGIFLWSLRGGFALLGFVHLLFYIFSHLGTPTQWGVGVIALVAWSALSFGVHPQRNYLYLKGLHSRAHFFQMHGKELLALAITIVLSIWIASIIPMPV
jgi:hypothetical protein